MMKKRTWLLPGMVMLIVLISACTGKKEPAVQTGGSKGNANVDITGNILLYHHLAEMVPIFDEFIADVRVKYPNLKIDQELQRESSTLQVKYASGDDPDFVIGPQTQQYIEQGKYQNLANMPGIENLEKLCYDIVYDPDLNGIYRVPLCNRAGGLFYNKEIINQMGLDAPKTWSEWVEDMKAIKKAMPDVTPYGYNRSHHPLIYTAVGNQMVEVGSAKLHWAMQHNDTAVLQFDKPGGYIETWAQRVVGLVNDGLIDPELALSGNDDMVFEMFATNKTAYITSGSSWYAGCVQRFPQTAEKFGLWPIPPTVDGMTPFTVVGPDSAVSVSAIDPDQKAIAAVLGDMFSEKFLVAYSKKRGAASAFTNITSNWSSFADEAAYNLSHYPIVTTIPALAGFSFSDMSNLQQELIVGTYNPRQFSQEFAARWNGAFRNASR
jgi:raffinose/stachyose/melibiose transport system substrate-binding protein